MKILIVQLSDVHITEHHNPILSRVGNVSDAVKNLDYQLDACFLVVSGDVAFSGQEPEYEIAMDFVGELKHSLDDHLHVKNGVELLVTPGNHDCDLSGSRSVRSTLTSAVTQDPSKAEDPGMQEACTDVQANFFSFLEAVSEDSLKFDDRLYYEYQYSVDGRDILFRCYNTAWLSQLNEEPAHLIYPVSNIPDERNGHDLVVSVFHHPYAWLHPDNARVFKRHVEGSSHIVLTGHEHDQGSYVKLATSGEKNEYIEGGVLQESNEDVASSFNALILDLGQRKQKLFHFSWDGELYSPLPTSKQDWEEFQVDKLLTRRDFEVQQDFEQYLQDPGVTLTHSSKGQLKLVDVFVYPNLREINYDNEYPQMIKGDFVLDHLLEQTNVFIAGAEKAGKTSLAKILFVEFYKRGFIPIIVPGSRFKARYDDKLIDSFYELFQQQYVAGSVERYKQLDKAKRVVILDDLDRLKVTQKYKDRFFDLLQKFCGRTVLLANDLSSQVEELMEGEEKSDFLVKLEQYRIQEFGHVRRERLIEKWFSLSEEDPDKAADLAERLNKAHKILDTVIGKNFVPAFPIFILSMLQSQEAAMAVDTKASTYGYFYELFIKTSLAATSTAVEYDVKNAYLSFLAYHLFAQRQKSLTVDAFREVHTRYESQYEIKVSFDLMLKELPKAQILQEANSRYGFKYPYIYYYFVANYLSNNVSDPEVRNAINRMSERLYVEEFANILLFVAHLSKHEDVVKPLLANARKLYSDYSPTALERDVDFLNDLDEAVSKVVYLDKGSSSREEALEKMDEHEEEDNQSDSDLHDLDPSTAILDPVLRLNIALKTLQILGQMLKNFPGSIKGDLKYQMAEECYQLGLRSLRALFDLMEERQEDFLTAIVDYMRKESLSRSDEELVKKAKRTMFNIAEIVSYGMIKRVSRSVGTEILTETYRRVLDNNSTPAYSLIDTSIRLDHDVAKFPEEETVSLGDKLKGNPIAISVLRHLVVNHFYLFPAKLKTKQSVCARLGIPYKKVQVVDPKLKKIKGQ